MHPELQFIKIETERLLLRRFKHCDVTHFFNYRTLPEVAVYQSEFWLRMSLDEAALFVMEQEASEPCIPGTWFQIAVEYKDTGELIGDLGLHTLEDERQAEIGFTIAPAHQHKGFAIEAVRALLLYLFTERRLHRVIAISDIRNSSSWGLLEKLGMRREGFFLQSTWNKGIYTDEYQYAVLRDEYMRAVHSTCKCFSCKSF